MPLSAALKAQETIEIIAWLSYALQDTSFDQFLQV